MYNSVDNEINFGTDYFLKGQDFFLFFRFNLMVIILEITEKEES